MTTTVNPNPSDGANTFPPKERQTPTAGGAAQTDKSGVDTVANRLAHKGAKAEQNFDKENGKLFST
jgi:hypothetical protein